METETTTVTEESTGAEEQLPKAANLSIGDLASRLNDERRARSAKPGTGTGKGKSTSSASNAAANNEQAAGEETGQTDGTETELEQKVTKGNEGETTEESGTTEEQPEGDVEQEVTEEEAPEGETEGEETPKSQKEMLKRINKLTANWKAAQAEVERLKGEAPQERRPTGPDVPTDFVEGNASIREINGQLAFVDKALDWVDANPQGGLFKDDKGVETEVSPEQAAVIRRNAQRMQSELIAERSNLRGELRATFRQAEQKASAQAESSYPWLKDAESPMAQEFNALLKQIPQIRQQHFDWKEWLADAVAGRHARLKAAKAGKVGQPMVRRPTNPGAKPAAVVTRTQGMPRVNLKQKGAQEAEAQFKKSGSAKDLARMLTQQANARRAAA